MKFLVIGYGSIGKRHCNNLKILVGSKNIVVCRQPGEKKVPGLETYYNLDEAISINPDAAIVAVPTSLHIPVALICAKAGVHLFIEKPLSHNLQGIDGLYQLAKKNKLIVMGGCNIRFHPGLEKAKKLIHSGKIGKIISVVSQAGQYLPDWRPNSDYRNSYSAKKELGGGVILDLIHEIDYLYWLFGKADAIIAMANKSSSLDVDTEDNADILIRFKNNVQANIHLDYIQRRPQRICQIIGEKGTITWNYFEDYLKIFINGKEKTTVYSDFDKNDMYVKEIKHFISCLKNKSKPLIDLEQQIDVLNIAIAAKKSQELQRVINL